MARTGQPNSEGSQFFIVLSDDANAALTNPANAPYPYAIMGEVTSGMDVVDLIAAMPNSGDGPDNAALDPVVMTSVTVARRTSPRERRPLPPPAPRPLPPPALPRAPTQ